MSTKMKEHAVAGILLENYPGSDELILNGHTFAELKENSAVGKYTLAQLEESAKDGGDPLFGWIVREVKEGGERGGDPNFPYDAKLIVRVLERGRDDIKRIIGVFDDL